MTCLVLLTNHLTLNTYHVFHVFHLADSTECGPERAVVRKSFGQLSSFKTQHGQQNKSIRATKRIFCGTEGL